MAGWDLSVLSDGSVEIQLPPSGRMLRRALALDALRIALTALEGGTPVYDAGVAEHRIRTALREMEAA